VARALGHVRPCRYSDVKTERTGFERNENGVKQNCPEKFPARKIHCETESMNISNLYDLVSPEVSRKTIETIANYVARDILESVRWYDIDLDDIDRHRSIEYIQHRIKCDYNLK